MISIIVPVFNGEAYLDDCLRALLEQTYRCFELLIVDDGSTDGSWKIAREYAQRDSRVRVLTKPNGGSGAARNLGLAEAKGEYLVFVDQDDWVHPQYLELLLAGLECSGADVVQCGYEVIRNRQPEPGDQSLQLYREYTCREYMQRFCTRLNHVRTVVLWNKLYRKELFDGLAFPEGKCIDDEYLFCPVISRAKKIVEIGNILYFYYQSENSQMRRKPDIRMVDRIEAVEQQMAFFQSMGERALCNQLLYRYYILIAEAYRVIRADYPEEKQLLWALLKKRRCWPRALLVPQLSCRDKCSLVLRLQFPGLYEMRNSYYRKGTQDA